MDNKALIRRWIEGINEGDLAVVDEVLDPGLVAHERDGDLRGTDVPKNIVTMFRTGFPNLLLTVEDLVAEGDRIAVRYWASSCSLQW